MNYPFEFAVLPLTAKLVRYLGFDNWWGDSGEGLEIGYGKENSCKSEIRYRLRGVCEESEPYTYGGYHETAYVAAYVSNYEFEPLYFFHELLEDIEKNCNEQDYKLLMDRWNKLSVRYYIEEYFKFKGGKDGVA